MTEEKQKDPLDYSNHKIVGVSPLFPCLAIITVASKKEDETKSENLFGVPGFYDSMSKCFIRLDGKKVSEDFRVKISGFIDNKFPENQEKK